MAWYDKICSKLEGYVNKIESPYVEIKINLHPIFDHGIYAGMSFRGITYRVNPRDRVFYDDKYESKEIEIPYDGDVLSFVHAALTKLKELYEKFGMDESEINEEFETLSNLFIDD